MALLIKNGEIITADAPFTAPTSTSKTKPSHASARHWKRRPDAEVIDAYGKLVFPGFIDPHVHIYLPFMATFAKDTHETASIAALMGGTTTFHRDVLPFAHGRCARGYELWKSKAEGNSACDYTFHMSVTKFEDKTEGQLVRS